MDAVLESARQWRTATAILSVALGTLILVLAGPTAAAEAATITVTTTAENSTSSDGLCSLKEAVGAANSNSSSGNVLGECDAGQATPVVDRIEFKIPGGGVKTINLTTTWIQIDEAVTIDGYTQGSASEEVLSRVVDRAMIRQPSEPPRWRCRARP